jgi:signal-transduction protein with cAMP-binding, CBS, and nucleotidyltransferase domain
LQRRRLSFFASSITLARSYWLILGVVDETRTVVGALSARDLLRLRAEGSVTLGDEILVAANAHELGRAWARLPVVAASLLAEGLSGREIAAMVSHQLAALTERAAILAEQRLRTEGLECPTCAKRRRARWDKRPGETGRPSRVAS